jgi:hypothetical protein
MSFGGHRYGIDADNETEQSDVQYIERDSGQDGSHDADVCNHTNCTGETPEPHTRICDDCTFIMHPQNSDRCSYCGQEL